MVKKTRRARVPKDSIDLHSDIANKFGFNATTKGFSIMSKVLRGEAELTRKKTKGRKKKYIWEIEFDDI